MYTHEIFSKHPPIRFSWHLQVQSGIAAYRQAGRHQSQIKGLGFKASRV